MISKVKNLKVSNILFLILLSGFLYFLTTAKSEGPENYEELMAQHEPWLRQVSKEISSVMDDDNSYTYFAYRTTLLVSYYTSPNFNVDKLYKLKTHLEQESWQQLPTENYIGYGSESLGMTGQPVTNSTVILCKNESTILIWMENVKGKYEHTNDISTSIRLTYDFHSPCFNLNNSD